MNTSQENPKAVAENTAGHAVDSSSSGTETADTKGKKMGVSEPGAVVMLFFFVGFIASLVVGWVVFPKLLYSKQDQPINFSHKLHNPLVEEGCQSCHFFREDGTFSGAPKLKQCIDCHYEVQGVSAEEKKFVNEYVAKDREVPWLIYSEQPDCVFFSHAAHVQMAEMDCVTCHGHIGESDGLRVYEENRITGYSRDIWGKNIAGLSRNTWDRMKMYNCAVCHDQQLQTEAAVDELPWPLSWMPRAWKWDGGRKTSVQTQKDACFVCHK